LVDLIQKNEMGGASSTNEDNRGAYMVWWGHLVEKEQLEDLEVGGRIVLKLILKSGLETMDCIDVVRVRNGWRALVYTVMNFRVP
jgi:hypothetical protein